MRIVIVGGVAGGMSCAARARRLDESAEIIVLERGAHVSFANCGLPYFVGGEITDPRALLVQTPESLRAALALDVRPGNEVIAVDADAQMVTVRSADGSSRSATTRSCCRRVPPRSFRRSRAWTRPGCAPCEPSRTRSPFVSG